MAHHEVDRRIGECGACHLEGNLGAAVGIPPLCEADLPAHMCRDARGMLALALVLLNPTILKMTHHGAVP